MNRPDESVLLNASALPADVENDLDARIAEAVNEYEALVRSGAKPNLTLFLARYQDLEPGLNACIEAINFVDNAFAKRSIRRSLLPLDQKTQLGDFQILRKVGGGGMGDVYEAYQLSLARRVALKVMASNLASSQHSLKRFQHESIAAATLQHPHIVPVYSVGQVDGNYFYAMQFIDGASLAELLLRFRGSEQLSVDAASPTTDASNPLPSDVANVANDVGTVVNNQSTQETYRDGAPTHEDVEHHPLLNLRPRSLTYYQAVARIIKQAAEALQHAHDNGIIHRDIKPSNLLMDLKCHVWVADFGLARLPESNITASSDVLGTLRYMSPEQASGRAVALDGRTDIYSLGATMYEMLTLQPLFESDDRRSMLQKVIEAEPIALRQHCPQIPRDLETISLKALSKEAEQRYASAAELAADLDRYLADRPILAKPPTVRQILTKWLKRNRQLVLGLATLVVLLLLVAIAATSIALNRISIANRLTVAANQRLVEALEEKDASLYRANMILARRDWDSGSHDGARARLNATSERHRMWEWQYLNAICKSPTRELDSPSIIDLPLVISQDGHRMLGYRPLQNESLLSIETIPGWDGERGNGLRFKPSQQGFEFHYERGYTMCKSGQYAAAIETDKLVSVLNTDSGQLLQLLSAPLPIQGALVVEDDGNVLAPLRTKDKTKIWDLGRNVELSEFDDVSRVRCWSADCELIYQDSGVIRESHSGKEVAKVSEIVRVALAGGVCRFSPNGQYIAGGGKNGTRVIEAKTGFERFLFADGNIGNLLAFSPDGARLATAGYDRSLRIYELLTGKLQMQTYIDSPGSLVLAFQADGTTLLSATNLQFKLWNCLDLIEGEICAAINPTNISGETEVLCEGKLGNKRVLQRLDTRNNATIESFELPTQDSVNLEVCSKSMIAALRTRSNTLLWDLEQQRLIAELPTFSSYTMRFSPDGKWLVTDSGFANPRVVLIDVGLGAVAQTLEHPGLFAKCFQFSGDSSQLFVGYQSGDVVAWNTVSGEKCWSANKHSQSVGAIQVDPTNRYVASAGTDEIINILDLNNGELVHRLEGHASQISALAFHPSQPRLATAGADSIIRIWDTQRWEPIFQIPSVAKSDRLEFSPSGNRLVSFQTGAVVSFDIQMPPSREEQRKAWLHRSLARAEQFKNSYAAEWFLSELIKVDPKNTQVVSRLAEIKRHHSDAPAKQRSIARNIPLVANKIEDLSIRAMESAYATAAHYALLNDEDAVKRVADHVVGQVDDKSQGWIASLAFRLYLFAPIEPTRSDALLSSYDKQTQAYKSQLAAHMVRGGLQYRAGQYDRALQSLMLAENFEAESKVHPVNWLLLSMTQSQLGNLTEAEQWLSRAVQWRAKISSTDFSKLDYQVRLPLLVLRLEATKLLAEKRELLKQASADLR